VSESLDFTKFASIIAETFDQPPSSITRSTHCDDVPGWDSLGHSVLLSRLNRRLSLALAEADAAPAETVGELFDRLAHRHRAVPA
jgi:acyl carrier protein